MTYFCSESRLISSSTLGFLAPLIFLFLLLSPSLSFLGSFVQPREWLWSGVHLRESVMAQPS